MLTLDWNKYRPFVLASAGVDKIVKIWDCRMIKMGELGQVGGACETRLLGHEYAVRKVQWSPHRADVLATASYDMTCRVYVFHFILFSKDPDCSRPDGIPHLRMDKHSCCTSMIYIPSSSSAVDGRFMKKECWQAVDGIVN